MKDEWNVSNDLITRRIAIIITLWNGFHCQYIIYISIDPFPNFRNIFIFDPSSKAAPHVLLNELNEQELSYWKAKQHRTTKNIVSVLRRHKEPTDQSTQFLNKHKSDFRV